MTVTNDERSPMIAAPAHEGHGTTSAGNTVRGDARRSATLSYGVGAQSFWLNCSPHAREVVLLWV